MTVMPSDRDRVRQAEQQIEQVKMRAARMAAREDSEVYRKARTHMLCCLGGAALHWIGNVDPFDFVASDFERLFADTLSVKTESGKEVVLSIGELVCQSWRKLQSEGTCI